MARLLWCESLMPTMRALALQDFIEEQTGEPCPCKEGRACPLVPLPRGAVD